MPDKELREQLYNIIPKYVIAGGTWGIQIEALITEILALIKVNGEPPVLTDEQIKDITLKYYNNLKCKLPRILTIHTGDCYKVAQAQHDADVKFYKGT